MTISAGLNSISVSRDVPLDGDGTFIEDIIGMRVYVSETSPVVANATNLKYSGASLSATISGLKGGTQYYVGTALVSSLLGNEFTDDELLLVYEGSIATLKAPGSVSVQLSAPSVTLQADASGTVSDYSTSGTTLKVFDGVTPIAYDGVGTSNNTWKVVLSASNITAGSVSDSGDYATVGSHSNMTSDSASVTYTVSGVTSLGSSFSQTITQYLTKSRKGTRGWTIARIDAWTDSAANAAIAAVATTNNASPTTPIKGDTVFYTGGAKQYDGSSWASAGQFIDGSLIVNGTVIGTHLAAQFSIRSGGKIIVGDETNGVVLNSDKTIKVLSDGGVKAILGEIDGSYGFRAYSPAGTLLFDSLADTAFLADVDKNNYLVGDSTTFPTFSDTSSGGYNLALGSGTLTGAASPTRKFNVAVGTEALHSASGSSNTAVGTASQFGGYSGEHTGDFNTSVGCDSLRSLSYGSGNTAIGGSANKSLSSITNTTSIGTHSSANNGSTAVGWGAGSMTALDSVSIGSEAGNSSQNYSISVGLYSNAGQESVTAGYRAGNSGSSYSVAVGGYSGYNSTSANSVFIGRSAGSSASGNNSVAVGYQAGITELGDYAISIGADSYAGQESVTVGDQAGNSGSSYSVAVGKDSGKGVGDYTVAVGHQAGYLGLGNNSTVVGYRAGQYATAASITAVGYSSAKSATGTSLVAVGSSALENSTGNYNTAVGYTAGLNLTTQSGVTLVGSHSGRASSNNYCTAVGYASAYRSTSSDYLTAIGYYAGDQAVGSPYGVMIGISAGQLSSSPYSIFIGYNSGKVCTSSGTIAIGHSAASVAETGPATIVGHLACRNATSVEFTTSVGYQSLYSLTTGSSNSVFGYIAGYRVTTGVSNTLVGVRVGEYLTSGSNNVFIGNYAGSAYKSNTSNCVILGGYTTPESDTILLSTGDGTSLRAKCTSSGEWDFKGKIGYKTTSSVTQTTSRSTGVTLNDLTGKITLVSEAVVAGAVTSFTVTNSMVSATDVVTIHQVSGTSPLFVSCTGVSSGSFRVSITSPVAVSATAIDLRFSISLGG